MRVCVCVWCVYAYMGVCMCVRVCVCVWSVCLSICLCVCVYVCICVCVHEWVRVCVCVNTRADNEPNEDMDNRASRKGRTTEKETGIEIERGREKDIYRER